MKLDTFDDRLSNLCHKFIEEGKEGANDRTEMVATMLAHLAATFWHDVRGTPEWPETPAGFRLGISEELQDLSQVFMDEANSFIDEVC